MVRCVWPGPFVIVRAISNPERRNVTAARNKIYDMIDEVRVVNDAIREQAFNGKREDLWRLYEVGHNAQLALAAYVVALTNSDQEDLDV